MSQKNQLQPWRTERFCIPEKDRARFVAQMEEVLDVYQAKHDDKHPLICMDEAAKEVQSDEVPPLPYSAMETVLNSGQVTADLGGTKTTDQVGDAVCAAL